MRPAGLGSLAWFLGWLFLAGPWAPGQEGRPEAPVQGIPVQALVAGPDGGLVGARLVGWKGSAPLLVSESGEASPLSGPVAWMALPGLAPRAPSPSLVSLFPSGTLGGELAGGDEEGEFLDLTASPLGPLRLPVSRVQALVFTERTAGWTLEELLPRAGPGQEVLLVPARQGFDTLPGFLYRAAPEALHFAVGQSREPSLFPLQRVAALIRGSGPRAGDPEREFESNCRLGFLDGTWIPARLLGLAGSSLELGLPWGEKGQVALHDLAGLDLPGPDRVFLSQLVPVRVEETPFLGSKRPTLFPWRPDRSCVGGALISGGRLWTRGIGCHARTRLTFDLEGRWEGFFTLIAVDDSALGLPVPGDLAARIFLDGTLLWEKERIRGGEEPLAVGPLRVAGGQSLTLEVDYGQALHLGDRANWLLPLLFR